MFATSAQLPAGGVSGADYVCQETSLWSGYRRCQLLVMDICDRTVVSRDFFSS